MAPGLDLASKPPLASHRLRDPSAGISLDWTSHDRSDDWLDNSGRVIAINLRSQRLGLLTGALLACSTAEVVAITVEYRAAHGVPYLARCRQRCNMFASRRRVRPVCNRSFCMP
jgi:hypothetical protein